MICGCSHQKVGFTDGGDGFWVCGECGNPTLLYLERQGDELLNLFKGGPLDGKAYETTVLLTAKGLPELGEYVWTPEKVTSQSTGRVARVWNHRTVPVVAVVEQPVRPAEKKERNTMSQEVVETDLLVRRKALGLSRKKLAELVGTTEAKVWRIETGGTRTTEEEKLAYASGLDSFENTKRAEDEASAAAAQAEAAAAPSA